MVCLRTDLVLSVVCSNTLLGLKLCDGPVFDFTIIQHDNINHCEILFLTQSKNNSDTAYTLCLVSYPGEQIISIYRVLFISFIYALSVTYFVIFFQILNKS